MSVTEKRTELYVGLFVFVGLAIMAVLILQFGRLGDRVKDSYRLQVKFDDATGIFEGVDVRLGGVKIGSVSERARPDPQLKGVIVELVIFSEFKIPRNGEFRIRTSGLMGDSYVGLDVPTPAAKEFFEPDETIDGISGGDIAALTNTAEELSKKAEALLDELNGAVKDVRGGVENLKSALAKFDEDVLGPENIENIKVAVANFRETSDKLNEAGDQIGPVLEDARSAAQNANGAFESAREIIIQLEPVIADIEKAAKGAAGTVSDMTEGGGLMAALINDPQLRADFTALIANLRAHGVLRYKDSAASTARTGSSARTTSSSSSPPARPAAQAPSAAPAEAAEPEKKKWWRPFNRRR